MNRRNFLKKSGGALSLGGVTLLAGCGATANSYHCDTSIGKEQSVAFASGEAVPSGDSKSITVSVDFKDKNNNTLFSQKETQYGVDDEHTWNFHIAKTAPTEKVQKVRDCRISVSEDVRD